MRDERMDFGIKAFIVKDGKFLVMHNNGVKEELWELPGGRMEFGELIEETVVRELYEEAKLTVKPIKVMDTWHLMGDTYQISGVIYLCEYIGGEVKISDEHDRYLWLSLEEKSLDYLYDVFKKPMKRWDWELLTQIKHSGEIREHLKL